MALVESAASSNLIGFEYDRAIHRFRPTSLLHEWRIGSVVMGMAPNLESHQIVGFRSRERPTVEPYFEHKATAQPAAELRGLSPEPPRATWTVRSVPSVVATIWQFSFSGEAEVSTRDISQFANHRFSRVVMTRPDGSMTLLHGAFPDTPHGDTISVVGSNGVVAGSRAFLKDASSPSGRADLALVAASLPANARTVPVIERHRTVVSWALVHEDSTITLGS